MGVILFQAPVDETGGVQGKSSRGATTQDSKKINDYFAKQQGTSPVRHGGAKSPSAQPSYPMVRIYKLEKRIEREY